MPGPRRRWWLGSLAAALVAVTALVGLGAWAADRPGAESGDGLAALRPAASPPPSATPSVRATARAAAPADVRSRVAASPPARIRIPSLDVDASVRPVGVQPDGAMVIPAAPTSVGWYRFGSAPADPAGHTVIAGHVATREDGPGALAPLADIEAGARVEVTDAAGEVHGYVVRGREAVHKKALPVDEIFDRDGDPLLVLVTCGGEYLPELRSHRDNVVVTAEPVP